MNSYLTPPIVTVVSQSSQSVVHPSVSSTAAPEAVVASPAVVAAPSVVAPAAAVVAPAAAVVAAAAEVAAAAAVVAATAESRSTLIRFSTSWTENSNRKTKLRNISDYIAIFRFFVVSLDTYISNWTHKIIFEKMLKKCMTKFHKLFKNFVNPKFFKHELCGVVHHQGECSFFLPLYFFCRPLLHMLGRVEFYNYTIWQWLIIWGICIWIWRN